MYVYCASTYCLMPFRITTEYNPVATPTIMKVGYPKFEFGIGGIKLWSFTIQVTTFKDQKIMSPRIIQ